MDRSGRRRIKAESKGSPTAGKRLRKKLDKIEKAYKKALASEKKLEDLGLRNVQVTETVGAAR